MLRSLFLTGIVLSNLACGGDGPPTDPEDCEVPKDPQTFEVGTGEICLERLANGDAITQWAGPQGGYHLFIGVGCADCGDEVRVRVSALDPTTGEALPGTYDTEEFITLYGEAWKQGAGLQYPMPGGDFAEEGEQKLDEGTALQLVVQAMDADGNALHDATLDLVIGPTRSWDPCESGSEECCSDCDG